jgi:CheY-like chemotaxis protein
MKRILIVDDQAIVAEPLAIVLRQDGYHSEVVTIAVTALAICRTREPDLIVCDIDMPGIADR